MPNEYILVTYSSNWADEMDVGGVKLMKRHQWNALVDKIRTYFRDGGSRVVDYVGTNQEIEYDSFNSWYSCYFVTEIRQNDISLDAYRELLQALPINNFFTPEPDDYDY